jgi:hypothetical protein
MQIQDRLEWNCTCPSQELIKSAIKTRLSSEVSLVSRLIHRGGVVVVAASEKGLRRFAR